MFSDEGSESNSLFSIVDYFQDFPLCCQGATEVEAIFRPTINTDESNQKENTRADQIMEKPWVPPRYRDTSLLVAPRDAKDKRQPSSYSPKLNTQSVGVVSCDEYIPSRRKGLSTLLPSLKTDGKISLPPEFVPPKSSLARTHTFEFEVFSSEYRRNHRVSNREEDSLSLSYSKSQSSTSSTINLTLEPTDVVCGRGAPTSIHPGNLTFKKIIKENEMTYLCSTRSEKPRIAMKILEDFRARSVRFIKRERNHDGDFEWREIDKRRSYEKICQSLREGAPQLRRQMMATKVKRMKSVEDKKYQKSNCGHFQQRQQRQDLDTAFSDETTTRIVYEVSHTQSSSFSTIKRTNVDPCYRAGEQTHCNSEWITPYEDHYKGYVQDSGVPYYIHLPPHLGGERLFQDRI